MSKKNFKSSIPVALALMTFFIGLFFSSHRNMTEIIYTHPVYPKLAAGLSFFSSLFPFSLFDSVLTLLFLVLLICLFLLFLRKIGIRIFLLRLIHVVCVIYTVFYWFWGFNYYRQSAEDRLDLPVAKVDTVQFKEVLQQLVLEVNKNYSKDSIDVQSAAKINESTYKDMADMLGLEYPCGNRRVKYITFSSFFAKAGIGGYFGPFFNEVHADKYISKWDVPMVVAHEMSHQFGITSEAEANFYAWLICTHSDNQFTRYSGWLYALTSAFRQAGSAMDLKQLVKQVKPEVIEDIKSRNEHWKNLRNKKVDAVMTKVNDTYLKTNKIKKGIKDYGGMVQLIMDVYQSDKENLLPYKSTSQLLFSYLRSPVFY